MKSHEFCHTHKNHKFTDALSHPCQVERAYFTHFLSNRTYVVHQRTPRIAFFDENVRQKRQIAVNIVLTLNSILSKSSIVLPRIFRDVLRAEMFFLPPRAQEYVCECDSQRFGEISQKSDVLLKNPHSPHIGSREIIFCIFP